jgi:hypothetical protein
LAIRTRYRIPVDSTYEILMAHPFINSSASPRHVRMSQSESANAG